MAPQNGADPASAATECEVRKVVGTGKRDRRSFRPTPPNPQPVRAELTGSDTCAAGGITTRSSSSVLALCRALVAAGHNPDQRLEIYRGDVLALTVRSIGLGARLEIASHGVGFQAACGCGAASPARSNVTADAKQPVRGPSC